jgi:hypothetical protein
MFGWFKRQRDALRTLPNKEERNAILQRGIDFVKKEMDKENGDYYQEYYIARNSLVRQNIQDKKTIRKVLSPFQRDNGANDYPKAETVNSIISLSILYEAYKKYL